MPQFWAGFVDDKLDRRKVDNGFGGWGCEKHLAPALFTDRDIASIHYQDVRKVEVRVVSKGNKARKK